MRKYQVVLIGGGAAGSGVLRDLALRGIKTALVEKGDLCSGALARDFFSLPGKIKFPLLLG